MHEIKQYLHYNPETGIFTWTDHFNRRDLIGKQAGSIHQSGYVYIWYKNKNYRAHRLAYYIMTGVFPKIGLDHIDLNRSNNKWANIREADYSENKCNSPICKANTSGIKGISFDDKKNLWVGTIRKNGERYRKRCKNLDVVLAWLDQKRLELHKDFARIG